MLILKLKAEKMTKNLQLLSHYISGLETVTSGTSKIWFKSMYELISNFYDHVKKRGTVQAQHDSLFLLFERGIDIETPGSG